jgi:uncharacterized membrane protein
LLKLRGREKFQKYGIYGLIPGVTFIGVYGCATTAWVFGWDKRGSIILISTGLAIISIIVLLSTLGLLKYILH